MQETNNLDEPLIVYIEELPLRYDGNFIKFRINRPLTMSNDFHEVNVMERGNDAAFSYDLHEVDNPDDVFFYDGYEHHMSSEAIDIGQRLLYVRGIAAIDRTRYRYNTLSEQVQSHVNKDVVGIFEPHAVVVKANSKYMRARCLESIENDVIKVLAAAFGKHPSEVLVYQYTRKQRKWGVGNMLKRFRHHDLLDPSLRKKVSR
ncbi:MAG: hypothetical protein Q4C83_00375 [Candidatus Saccharibacteria bacterium]|nr:hypothetical protein [Candidatus Saccharibacteria bacterium]